MEYSGVLAALTGCGTKAASVSTSVVINVSGGRVFAEPVQKDFDKETGTKEHRRGDATAGEAI